MKRILAVILLSAVGGVACAGSTPRTDPGATGRTSTQANIDERAGDAGSEPLCDDLFLWTAFYSGPPESPVLPAEGGRVPADANIFGAGRDAPPNPGGGEGGGSLPPVYLLPTGTSHVVTFPSVTGRVYPSRKEPYWWNGPEGHQVGYSTDVESLLGIAGILHGTKGMFLAGVFLTDAPASSPAPPRLDFTGEDRFDLAPEIGQTFLVGHGKGRSYAIPDDATRLFLGFADALDFHGCPGWYGNNEGRLTVTIDIGKR